MLPLPFKMLLFSGYLTFVLFLLDTVWSFVFTFLDLSGLRGLACQLGVVSALNVFLSILVSGYLARKTASFWRL